MKLHSCDVRSGARPIPWSWIRHRTNYGTTRLQAAGASLIKCHDLP